MQNSSQNPLIVQTNTLQLPMGMSFLLFFTRCLWVVWILDSFTQPGDQFSLSVKTHLNFLNILIYLCFTSDQFGVGQSFIQVKKFQIFYLRLKYFFFPFHFHGAIRIDKTSILIKKKIYFNSCPVWI